MFLGRYNTFFFSCSNCCFSLAMLPWPEFCFAAFWNVLKDTLSLVKNASDLWSVWYKMSCLVLWKEAFTENVGFCLTTVIWYYDNNSFGNLSVLWSYSHLDAIIISTFMQGKYLNAGALVSEFILAVSLVKIGQSLVHGPLIFDATDWVKQVRSHICVCLTFPECPVWILCHYLISHYPTSRAHTGYLGLDLELVQWW